MDERLKKALEFSNYSQTIHRQKNNLKLRAQELLTYSFSGGIFRINQELIGFVFALLQDGHDQAVLLDIHENPILVDNLEDFYDEIKSRYFEVINEYYDDYEKLRKKRSVGAAVEW